MNQKDINPDLPSILPYDKAKDDTEMMKVSSRKNVNALIQNKSFLQNAIQSLWSI